MKITAALFFLRYSTSKLRIRTAIPCKEPPSNFATGVNINYAADNFPPTIEDMLFWLLTVVYIKLA